MSVESAEDHNVMVRIENSQERRKWVIDALIPYIRSVGGTARPHEAARALGRTVRSLLLAVKDATRYVTHWEDTRQVSRHSDDRYMLTEWGHSMPAYMARVDPARNYRNATG